MTPRESTVDTDTDTDTDTLPLQDLLTGVGRRLRDLRKARGLTLQGLADASGLSVSMLSSVERGTISPSVATLYGIASALDVSMQAVFASPDDDRTLLPVEDHRTVLTDGGAQRRIAVDSPGAHFELYVDVYEPSTAHAATPSSHPGLEFGLCLTGDLTVEVAGVAHHLRPGDAVQYDARQRHHIRNEGDRPAEAVWINVKRV